MAVNIIGTGRSGTTWLAHILNYDETYDYVFEPLHYNKPGIKALFGRRKYIRRDCVDKRYTDVLRDIFSGNRRLTKSVRAHLLVPWIHNNISDKDKDCKLIYLLRNPGAVALSWADRNWDARKVLTEIWNQPELLNDYPLIAEIKSQIENDIIKWGLFERQVLTWAIENYVALDYLKNFNNWLLVCYEDLITDTENQIARIYKFLNQKKYDLKRIMETIKKPSPTCRKNSAILTGDDLVNAWKFKVNQISKNNMIEIIKIFPVKEFERYYQ